MIQVGMSQDYRFDLFWRNMHGKPDVVVDHNSVVEDNIFLADVDGEGGPANFLAGSHTSYLHFAVLRPGSMLRAGHYDKSTLYAPGARGSTAPWVLWRCVKGDNSTPL